MMYVTREATLQKCGLAGPGQHAGVNEGHFSHWHSELSERMTQEFGCRMGRSQRSLALRLSNGDSPFEV